ncbi:MAG: hypothetical protein ACREL6_11210, partial [Gemmatimonadales bacterium]
MSGFAFLVNLTVMLEGLPPLVVLLRKLRKPAHLWIAAAFALSFTADMFAGQLGRRQINNQWVGYLVAPPIIAMFLLALARWQLSYVERVTLKLTAPLLVVTLYALTLSVENVAQFSRFTGPLGGLVLLVAALWTMLRRSFGPATQPHTRT